MTKSESQSVVFAQGEYTCKTSHGLVTVSIPRDVTLGDVAPAFAKLYERK